MEGGAVGGGAGVPVVVAGAVAELVAGAVAAGAVVLELLLPFGSQPATAIPRPSNSPRHTDTRPDRFISTSHPK